MNDKEFLDKLKTAYQAYQYPNKDIEAFISWVYKQYGFVEKKDKE